MVELYALIVKSSPKYIKLKKIKLQKTTYRMNPCIHTVSKKTTRIICVCMYTCKNIKGTGRMHTKLLPVCPGKKKDDSSLNISGCLNIFKEYIHFICYFLYNI